MDGNRTVKQIHAAIRQTSLIAFIVLHNLAGAQSAHSDEYFDWLSDQPETVLARSYKTQSEINSDIHAVRSENRVDPPVYDPVMDAAKWRIPAGKASIAVQDQLRPGFPRISSGNVLFFWETRWDSDFGGNLGGLETQKAFQLSLEGSGDERRIELRTRFSQAPPSGIARLDGRTYVWNPAEQPMSPQAREFTVRADTWTRFWAYVNFNTRRFSLWVADEDNDPVRVFNEYQFSSMSGGLDNFWFEFNSSQSRSGGNSLDIWSRNFVVMRNVDDVVSIVTQGASVDPSPDPIEPSPPTNLSAN